MNLPSRREKSDGLSSLMNPFNRKPVQEQVALAGRRASDFAVLVD